MGKKNRKNKNRKKRNNLSPASSKSRDIFADKPTTEARVEDLFTTPIKGDSDEVSQDDLDCIAELKEKGLLNPEANLIESLEFISNIKVAAESAEGDSMSKNNKEFDANKTASQTMNENVTEEQHAKKHEEPKVETREEVIEETIEEVLEEVVEELNDDKPNAFKGFFTKIGKGIQNFFTKIRKFVVRRKIRTVVTVVVATGVGVAAGILLPIAGAGAVFAGLGIAAVISMTAIIAQAYTDKEGKAPTKPLVDKVADAFKKATADAAANAEAYAASQQV